MRKALRDSAEQAYTFAWSAERRAIQTFEKEEESIANKFGSGKKG